MPRGGSSVEYEFNADAVRHRSMAEAQAAVEAANRRAEAAEQALRDAEQARRDAEQARRDAEQRAAAARQDQRQLQQQLAEESAAKEALWKEKRQFENENEVLLKRIATLTAQLAEATQRDRQQLLQIELCKVQRQLAERNKSLYGKSSERRDRDDDDDDEGDDTPRRRKRSGGKRTRQPTLPIEEVHHRLDPDCQVEGCPHCQGDLSEMDGQTEDSEEIDVVPIRYVIQQHIRHKYRCGDCGGITTSPGPTKLVDGGRYSIAFASQVAVDKYHHHCPLRRQVEKMARHGLTVTRQTLWNQLQHLYLLLLPVMQVLHDEILQADLVYVDETHWRMMPVGGGSERWWLWILSDGTNTIFQMVPSRGTEAARALLRDFDGVVMADDYAVYRALERERTRLGGVQQVIEVDGELTDRWTPDFLLASCMMHARRYLIKAEPYDPEANEGLDLIEELYAIEDAAAAEVDARCQGAVEPVSDEQRRQWLIDARRRHRHTRSRAVIDTFDAWRDDVFAPDGTALRDALDHIDRIWPRLTRFLDDPALPLDNGHAEREIRGPVVGRKNYQGVRSEAGANAAALFFGLIASAKNVGVDPQEYLEAAARHARIHADETDLRARALTPRDYADQLEALDSQT